MSVSLVCLCLFKMPHKEVAPIIKTVVLVPTECLVYPFTLQIGEPLVIKTISRLTSLLSLCTCIAHSSLLLDEYLATISKLEQFAAELYSELKDHGFRSMERSVREIPIDSIKFFLKQQQKKLEDNENSSKTGTFI